MLGDLYELSTVNGYLIRRWLMDNINKNIEHHGIKKISTVFLKSKFGSTQDFVDEYNRCRNKNIQFSQYYRGYK